MSRPKIFKEKVYISLVVEKELHQHLQRQASNLSLSEGKLVSLNRLINRALLTTFPLPKQEMFKFNI